MGASCCIAARKRPVLDQSAYRENFGCSQTSSLNENQTYSSVLCDNPLFQRNSHNSASDIKRYAHVQANDHFSRGDPSCSCQTANWKKSDLIRNVNGSFSVNEAGENNVGDTVIMKRDPDSSSTGSASPNLHPLIPVQSSSNKVEVLLPCSSFPPAVSSSKMTRLSVGYRIFKRISSSRLIKPFREHGTSEKRKFVENFNPSAPGSCRGSSDQWSMLLFPELATSSQRERSSLDSDPSNDYPYCSIPGSKLQNCEICFKSLNERPPWCIQFPGSTSTTVPVVAVLFCGHVYHSECLENQTLEMEKNDPPCPLCTSQSKQGSTSSSRKTGCKGRNKHSRAAVGNFDLDSSTFEQPNSMEDDDKFAKKGLSLKSSFTRHFWRSHISRGWRPL